MISLITQVRQESDVTGLSRGQCLSPDGESLSNSVGGSGPLLPMYLEMVSKEDKVIAERWADDASEILLFVSPDITHFPLRAMST